jgi:hypothetical protein
MNYRPGGFSAEKRMRFMTALGRGVDIRIKKNRRPEKREKSASTLRAEKGTRHLVTCARNFLQDGRESITGTRSDLKTLPKPSFESDRRTPVLYA